MTSSVISRISAPATSSEIVMQFLDQPSDTPISKESVETQKTRDVIYDVLAKRVLVDVTSVIFLDIDGVMLNFQMMGKARAKAEELSLTVPVVNERNFMGAALYFEKESLAALNKILGSRDIAIVLSSNRRIDLSVPKIREITAESFGDLIIDKTTDGRDEESAKRIQFLSESGFKRRGAEIQDWLLRHPEVTNHVILDDVDDAISPHFSDRFVQIKIHGDKYNKLLFLTNSDAERAMKILESNHLL